MGEGFWSIVGPQPLTHPNFSRLLRSPLPQGEGANAAFRFAAAMHNSPWCRRVPCAVIPAADSSCRVPLDLLTNPAFMAVAIIGVCLLGISKGGFLGLGVMGLPLMSLFVPPLQAAAIILPTAVAQDCLTLWI